MEHRPQFSPQREKRVSSLVNPFMPFPPLKTTVPVLPGILGLSHGHWAQRVPQCQCPTNCSSSCGAVTFSRWSRMDKIPMSRPIFMGCTDFLFSACIIAQEDNDCRLCSPFEKNFCSWDLALLSPTFRWMYWNRPRRCPACSWKSENMVVCKARGKNVECRLRHSTFFDIQVTLQPESFCPGLQFRLV